MGNYSISITPSDSDHDDGTAASKLCLLVVVDSTASRRRGGAATARRRRGGTATARRRRRRRDGDARDDGMQGRRDGVEVQGRRDGDARDATGEAAAATGEGFGGRPGSPQIWRRRSGTWTMADGLASTAATGTGWRIR
ncbi:hypothetical protein EJB05_17091, partial [Eragrostis curvula]